MKECNSDGLFTADLQYSGGLSAAAAHARCPADVPTASMQVRAEKCGFGAKVRAEKCGNTSKDRAEKCGFGLKVRAEKCNYLLRVWLENRIFAS